MSGWQAYVDQSLVGTGTVTKGALCGLDGTLWAVSPGFNPNQNELRALISGYTNTPTIQGSGIYLQGEKYLTLRADDASIYGKKGAGGVASCKTAQCVVIGLYGEGIQPGACSATVEKLAQYLRDQGY